MQNHAHSSPSKPAPLHRYMRAARVNEMVSIDADTLKSGKLLTFGTVDFKNEAGKLLAQGKHTKYVGVGW